MVEKSLDIKLARILAKPSCREFIIADAKDADMAYGIASPGKSPEHYAHEGRFRTMEEFRECIREVVRQGLVDIMLMSAHTSGLLTIEERLFENSHVTPACRANDATDVHVIREGVYIREPSHPFRTASIEQIQCGKVECAAAERTLGANLGLYSVTFNNDLNLDQHTLEAYRCFRIEAERKGFRHFLEVFDPNATVHPIPPEKIGAFINDMIVRSLAGVPESGRPLFLKMVYHGPKWTEELVRYDPRLVVGILGGASGTTYDAFKLISEAQKYGAKVALFGRKINNAEHQLAFIEMLRRIVDGQISPEEAVRAYHGILQALGIPPYRALEEDMQLRTPVMSYAGSSQVQVPAPAASALPESALRMARPTGSVTPADRTVTAPSGNGQNAAPAEKPKTVPTRPLPPGTKAPAATPDFASMSREDRLAYFRRRLSQT